MKIFKNKFVLLISLVLTLFITLAVLYITIYFLGGKSTIQFLDNCWSNFKSFLLGNGFWLFISLAILPGFILPCAPLLILAGIWGADAGILKACIYSVLALIVNLIWTYWFAHGPGNRLVNIVLKKFGQKIPQLPRQNLLQWSIILRLTPGIPFIFSNYILGLLKMPFSKYLLISIPIITITDCGFILATAGIFSSSWKYLWGGISILIIMLLIGKLISRKKTHAN